MWPEHTAASSKYRWIGAYSIGLTFWRNSAVQIIIFKIWSLWWVLLCWVLCFYCYSECHYVECRHVLCYYTECQNVECRYAVCCYAECRGAPKKRDRENKLFCNCPEEHWTLTSLKRLTFFGYHKKEKNILVTKILRVLKKLAGNDLVDNYFVRKGIFCSHKK